MEEVQRKPLMNRTIHWDLCHSHRPQNGGSRILARAQFWIRFGIQVVLCRIFQPFSSFGTAMYVPSQPIVLISERRS